MQVRSAIVIGPNPDRVLLRATTSVVSCPDPTPHVCGNMRKCGSVTSNCSLLSDSAVCVAVAHPYEANLNLAGDGCPRRVAELAEVWRHCAPVRSGCEKLRLLRADQVRVLDARMIGIKRTFLLARGVFQLFVFSFSFWSSEHNCVALRGVESKHDPNLPNIHCECLCMYATFTLRILLVYTGFCSIFAALAESVQGACTFRPTIKKSKNGF